MKPLLVTHQNESPVALEAVQRKWTETFWIISAKNYESVIYLRINGAILWTENNNTNNNNSIHTH